MTTDMKNYGPKKTRKRRVQVLDTIRETVKDASEVVNYDYETRPPIYPAEWLAEPEEVVVTHEEVASKMSDIWLK